MVMRLEQRQAVSGRGADGMKERFWLAPIDVPPAGQFLCGVSQFNDGAEFMI
jgi:hypothetical protein